MITSLSIDSLKSQPLTDRSELESYPRGCDLLTLERQSNAQYLIGFAASGKCLERALRLRYQVFNEELGEGLAESHITGLDRDEFDDAMHHIVLIKRSTNEIVGTYRIQTATDGLRRAGLYCAREYDLKPLEPYYPELVETGRACIEMQERNYATIMMLWKAIGVYMGMFDKRWLFGCCSLTSRDPDDGWRCLKTIRAEGAMHEDLMMDALPEFSCGDPSRENDPAIGGPIAVPKLFSAYLGIGSQVISYPAIDREFSTVDFLVMLDKERVSFSSLLNQS